MTSGLHLLYHPEKGSRRDLAFVEQLAADLQAAGLDVWYDLSGLENLSHFAHKNIR